MARGRGKEKTKTVRTENDLMSATTSCGQGFLHECPIHVNSVTQHVTPIQSVLCGVCILKMFVLNQCVALNKIKCLVNLNNSISSITRFNYMKYLQESRSSIQIEMQAFNFSILSKSSMNVVLMCFLMNSTHHQDPSFDSWVKKR